MLCVRTWCSRDGTCVFRQVACCGAASDHAYAGAATDPRRAPIAMRSMKFFIMLLSEQRCGQSPY